MNEDLKNNEIRYINILRALGIIAVVVGHSGSPIAPYLYLYHLALFFFISGFLFRDGDAQALRPLIRKRLRSLYLPYVGYNIFFLSLHNVFVYGNILNLKYDRLLSTGDIMSRVGKILLFSSDERMPSAMWFLGSLFFVTISFALIRRFSLRFARRELITVSIVAVIFTFGIMAFRRDAYFFLMLNNACVALPVFYAGHLYKRHEDRVPMRGALAAAALILLAALSRLGQIDLSANNYGPAWFFIVCSVAGIYANVYAAKAIAQRPGLHLLDRIGRNSIAILALHFLSFKVVILAQIALNSLPLFLLGSSPILDGSGGWWVLYSLVGIFVPLLARFAVLKSKRICVAYFERTKP